MEYNYDLIGYVLLTPMYHIFRLHTTADTVISYLNNDSISGAFSIPKWRDVPYHRLTDATKTRTCLPGCKTHVLFFSSAGDHKWRSHLSSRSVVNSPLWPLSLFSRLSPDTGKSSLNDTNALVMPLSLPRRATNSIWMSGTTPKVTPLMLVMDHRVFWLMRLDLPHLPCWGHTDGLEAG